MFVPKKILSFCLRYATLLAGLVAASAANAHHTSAAVFSTYSIEIEGYVTEFNFKNPHLNVILRVTGENGEETEWMATGPGPTPFRRWGWTPDTIEPGQYLRIFGRRSRDGGPMLLMEADDIHAGRVVELDPASDTIVRTISSTSTVSRPTREATASTEIPTLSLRHGDGRPNFDGLWLGSRDGSGRYSPPLNRSAAAMQEQFDPYEDDPAFRVCADAGLVRQATSIRPMKITQFDDRVVLEYEEFGAQRVIYLDGRKSENDQHSLYGSHVASYDGDVLTIETNQLLGNLSSQFGNALSDQTTVIETYRRLDDSTTAAAIEMRMVVTDPMNLTAPWEISSVKYYSTDPYEFIEVDCRIPFWAPEDP